MFCGKCGKEIVDDTKFCKYCGSPVMTRETVSAPEKSSEKNQFQNNSSESSNVFLNKIARIALVLALVFFCCPFVMVSCGSETAEVSGMEVMVGKDFGDEEVIGDDTPANVFLILAFLAGVGALGFTFADKTYRTTGVTALTTVSALGIIVFRANFFDYYKELQGYEIYIQFRWGWTMTLLAYILAFLCSLLQYLNGRMRD